MTPRAVLAHAHRARRETNTRAALAARLMVRKYAQQDKPDAAKLYLAHQRDLLEQARHWRAMERAAESAPKRHPSDCEHLDCPCQAYIHPAEHRTAETWEEHFNA